MPKLPFIKFFPNDWLAEPSVRACSLAARGLWMDMLSLMHLSPRRGYLLAATGLPLTPEQLARMTGCSADEVVALLGELNTSGCYSCTDDGTIYSRRMVREEGKRERCSEAGKKGGGNPAFRSAPTTATFKGVPKGAPKGHPKGVPKPLEARSQTPEPPTPTGAETGGGDGLKVYDPPEPEPPPEVGPNPEAVVAFWNSQERLPKECPKLSGRDQKIRFWATNRPEWVEHWRAVIAWLARSDFHCGTNDKQWRATLTWLVKEDSFERVLSQALAEVPRAPAEFVPKVHKLPATLAAESAPTMAELRERDRNRKAKGDAA